jgi:hypothetical protein
MHPELSPLRSHVILALGGILAIAATTVVAVGWAQPAAAACVVNTGTPGGGRGVNFSLDSRQHFAGEFTLTKSHIIDSIKGWLGSGPGSAAGGEVRITLHADGGDVPGKALFSRSFEPSVWVPDANPENWQGVSDWQGVSNLNWQVQSGTYWASFVPENGFSGQMPGIAPRPLDHYASNLDGHGWEPVTNPAVAVGIQITGEPIDTMAGRK